MVRHVARKYMFLVSREDYEDLAAEVRASFVRSANTFDPSKGFQFGTYAMRLARFAAHAAAQRLAARGVHLPGGGDKRKLKAPVPTVVAYAAFDDDGNEGWFENTIPEREPQNEEPAFGPDFWPMTVEGLTAKQAAVVLAVYRDGLSQTEAAARLGCTRSNVHQTLAAALDRLRNSEDLYRIHEDLESV